MSEREEFEKFIKKYDNNDFVFLIEMAEAWQEQQKKIDDLNLKLAIKDDMITALNLTIDTLKALNPDVPCPAIHQDKYGYNCAICGIKGTVPLTKAQEYRISELEAEIERLHK